MSHPTPIVHQQFNISLVAKQITSSNTYLNFCGYRENLLASKTWVHCRDTIGRYLNANKCGSNRLIEAAYNIRKYRAMDNSLSSDNIHLNIARFFWAVEGHMGWWDRTRVHTTQYDNHAAIFLSGGWFQNMAATALATLFFRIAPLFKDHQSLDDTFEKYEYSRCTRIAIWRFLNGYQHFNRQLSLEINVLHWRGVFQDQPSSVVNKLLIDRKLVEDKAKELWLEAGCPPNYNNQFWLEACRRLQVRLNEHNVYVPVYTP